MRIRRLLSIVASAGLVVSGIGLIAGPAAASSPTLAPTTVHYPNGTTNGPCDRGTGHTLQNCIDSVADGGTVLLTAQVIDESRVRHQEPDRQGRQRLAASAARRSDRLQRRRHRRSM